MANKSTNHNHRFVLRNIGNKEKPYKVYACIKPACTSYFKPELIVGKLVECFRCHEPMIYPKSALVGNHGTPLVKPHCVECTRKHQKGKLVDNIAEFLIEKTGVE